MRVYGLTQIEEYKWDEWQTAWRREPEVNVRKLLPSMGSSESRVSASVETVEETLHVDNEDSSTTQEIVPHTKSSSSATGLSSIPSPPSHDPSHPTVETAIQHSAVDVTPTSSSAVSPPTPTVDIDAIIDSIMQYTLDETTAVTRSLDSLTSSGLIVQETPSISVASGAIQTVISHTAEPPVTKGAPESFASSLILTTSVASTTSSLPTSAQDNSVPSQYKDVQLNSTSAVNVQNATTKPTSATSLPSVRSTVITVSTQPRPSPSASHSSHTPGSESIYRNIMNRLTVLESNSSLGVRYMEEQTRYLREMLKRLEQDVGRLETLVCSFLV